MEAEGIIEKGTKIISTEKKPLNLKKKERRMCAEKPDRTFLLQSVCGRQFFVQSFIKSQV
jgi:hypothetical protein